MSGNAAMIAALQIIEPSLQPLATDSYGRMALHWLISFGSAEMLTCYSSTLKLPLWMQDSCGNTCWHYVVKENRDELVGVLAEVNRCEAVLVLLTPNDEAMTPIQCARMNQETHGTAGLLTKVLEAHRRDGEFDDFMTRRLKRALQARQRRAAEALL
eukprot:m.129716 g.129716  ORF g.129716 m.129716 type:complete len:157 (+) comp15858_c0_seq1:459-929(+)